MERTKLKRIFITVAVALLVATAGCSSITGGDGGDGGDGGGGAQGYDKSGSGLDGETIANATTTIINDAGSYTQTEEVNATIEGEGVSLETTETTLLKVDLEAQKGLRNTTSEGGFGGEDTVVYTDGDVSYEKSGSGDDVEYSSTEGDSFVFIEEVNVTSYDGDARSLIDGANWTKDGGGTVDGVGVTEYSLESVENKSAFDIGENSTLSSSSATMSIDSDGVIRKASLSLTYTAGENATGFEPGTEVSIDVTQTVTNVGSTNVTEPGWVSEAEAA